MQGTAWLWWLVVILIVLGGAYFLFFNNETAPANINVGENSPATSTGATGTPGTSSGANTPMTAEIVYDGTKFTPQFVTIKKGGTVTWKNESSGDMWVASAQHPSHTVYSGTSRQEHCPDANNDSFDQCEGGGDYSFTFDKGGEWGFHDHINASAFGRVTVVE